MKEQRTNEKNLQFFSRRVLSFLSFVLRSTIRRRSIRQEKKRTARRRRTKLLYASAHRQSQFTHIQHTHTHIRRMAIEIYSLTHSFNVFDASVVQFRTPEHGTDCCIKHHSIRIIIIIIKCAPDYACVSVSAFLSVRVCV